MIDSLAKTGDPLKYRLPRAKVDGSPFDMSFSGLKTAVLNLANNAKQKQEQLDLNSLAASLCLAVSDTLVSRTIDAAVRLGYGKIAVAGGVAANSVIRSSLLREASRLGIKAFLAPLSLCGDNAAMIGCQGYYELLSGIKADTSLNAYATLSPEAAYVYR